MARPIIILPDPPSPPQPMGLIAGGGRLPILVAEGMRAAGHPVYCIGLSGQYPAELKPMCDRFREVGVLRLGSWIRNLRRMGVRHAVMVGQIDKARLLHSWAVIIKSVPDVRTLRLFFENRRDRRSHVMLAIVADQLSAHGVELIDSTTHIRQYMAHTGTITDHKPSASQKADIEFGWPLLLEMLRLDIGQSMAVRESDVIAVEAVEGTDRMIERAGQLCRASGWTLIKGARAWHDRRSDVPTIGPDTIENLHAAGGGCLAIAAEDVIMVDKADTITLADRLGISIVGVPPV